MKAKLIILAIILSFCFPATSNAFGILKYVFDGIANQLGLDRGPVPKTVPKPPPGVHGQPKCDHPDCQRIHIQAEGF